MLRFRLGICVSETRGRRLTFSLTATLSLLQGSGRGTGRDQQPDCPAEPHVRLCPTLSQEAHFSGLADHGVSELQSRYRAR